DRYTYGGRELLRAWGTWASRTAAGTRSAARTVPGSRPAPAARTSRSCATTSVSPASSCAPPPARYSCPPSRPPRRVAFAVPATAGRLDPGSGGRGGGADGRRVGAGGAADVPEGTRGEGQGTGQEHGVYGRVG